MGRGEVEAITLPQRNIEPEGKSFQKDNGFMGPLYFGGSMEENYSINNPKHWTLKPKSHKPKTLEKRQEASLEVSIRDDAAIASCSRARGGPVLHAVFVGLGLRI